MVQKRSADRRRSRFGRAYASRRGYISFCLRVQIDAQILKAHQIPESQDPL